MTKIQIPQVHVRKIVGIYAVGAVAPEISAEKNKYEREG